MEDLSVLKWKQVGQLVAVPVNKSASAIQGGTVIWKDLPEEDEAGNVLVYHVVEVDKDNNKVLDAYGFTAHSTCVPSSHLLGPKTITCSFENIKKNQETTVVVVKEFKDHLGRPLPASRQPESLTVEIREDGKVYDQVELSKSTGWTWWRSYKGTHRFQVVETHIDGKPVTEEGRWSTAQASYGPEDQLPDDERKALSQMDLGHYITHMPLLHQGDLVTIAAQDDPSQYFGDFISESQLKVADSHQDITTSTGMSYAQKGLRFQQVSIGKEGGMYSVDPFQSMDTWERKRYFWKVIQAEDIQASSYRGEHTYYLQNLGTGRYLFAKRSDSILGYLKSPQVGAVRTRADNEGDAKGWFGFFNDPAESQYLMAWNKDATIHVQHFLYKSGKNMYATLSGMGWLYSRSSFRVDKTQPRAWSRLAHLTGVLETFSLHLDQVDKEGKPLTSGAFQLYSLSGNPERSLDDEDLQALGKVQEATKDNKAALTFGQLREDRYFLLKQVATAAGYRKAPDRLLWVHDHKLYWKAVDDGQWREGLEADAEGDYHMVWTTDYKPVAMTDVKAASGATIHPFLIASLIGFMIVFRRILKRLA